MLDKTETTKICKDCLMPLPLTEFYRNGKGHSIGYRPRCKSCYSTRYKDSYKARDQDVLKAYNREYYNNRYKDEDFRRKKLARSTIITNVRRGYIARPTECPQCGSSIMIEAHHEDYNKPL